MTTAISSSGASPPEQRPLIDVSRLPSSALDHRSPIWWGNLMLLCIETSMFGLVIASYFYYRQNFDTWPPAKIDQMPVLYHPYPRLTLGTSNLVLLLASIIPMAICDRACLKMNAWTVKLAGTLCLLIGIAANWLRVGEFSSLLFRWDDNVYGSITWTLLGVHMMHLLILTCEDGLMMAYVWIKGLDDKHARDIRVTAVYWYWVVAVWVVVYVIIYWYPRWAA